MRMFLCRSPKGSRSNPFSLNRRAYIWKRRIGEGRSWHSSRCRRCCWRSSRTLSFGIVRASGCCLKSIVIVPNRPYFNRHPLNCLNRSGADRHYLKRHLRDAASNPNAKENKIVKVMSRPVSPSSSCIGRQCLAIGYSYSWCALTGPNHEGKAKLLEVYETLIYSHVLTSR